VTAENIAGVEHERGLLRKVRSACEGKVRRKRKHAEREVQRLNNKLRDTGNRKAVRAYQCPHCRAWHVGGYRRVPPQQEQG
jgi:hypothetical protein